MGVKDREIEIIHELATLVLTYETLLCESSDICGELDWYGTVKKLF